MPTSALIAKRTHCQRYELPTSQKDYGHKVVNTPEIMLALRARFRKNSVIRSKARQTNWQHHG
jgi:hypothetical protein